MSILLAVGEQKKLKVNKGIASLFLFSGFALLSSPIISNIYDYPNDLYMDLFASLACMLVTFVALHMNFAQIAKINSAQSYCDIIMRLLGVSYTLPIIIAAIDTLSIYKLLPVTVHSIILQVFGGWHLGRPVGTTGEASWLASHMLFAFCCYFYLTMSHNGKYRVRCIASAALFLLTQSLQGVALFVIGCLMFVFLYARTIKNGAKAIRTMIAVLASAALVCYVFYRLLMLNPDTYFAARILNFRSLNQLFNNDGSSFVRIIGALLNIAMFAENPLFGIGGFRYNNLVGDYIVKYFPTAIRHAGIAQASAVTIYLRIVAEHGLLGGLLYYSFFFYCLKRTRNIARFKYSALVLFWVSISLALNFQFASYAYTLPLVALAFVMDIPHTSLCERQASPGAARRCTG
jgi:hypothetical protein